MIPMPQVSLKRQCKYLFWLIKDIYIRYSKFLIALGNPLGWDLTFEHNFIKQQQYLSETKLPLANKNAYYKFIDVLEHLILLMIIRREVVHFGIKNNQLTLLNYFD